MCGAKKKIGNVLLREQARWCRDVADDWVDNRCCATVVVGVRVGFRGFEKNCGREGSSGSRWLMEGESGGGADEGAMLWQCGERPSGER